jgi:predicted  nucleic acid-binding Zn-ribbon protein
MDLEQEIKQNALREEMEELWDDKRKLQKKLIKFQEKIEYLEDKLKEYRIIVKIKGE